MSSSNFLVEMPEPQEEGEKPVEKTSKILEFFSSTVKETKKEKVKPLTKVWTSPLDSSSFSSSPRLRLLFKYYFLINFWVKVLYGYLLFVVLYWQYRVNPAAG